MPGKSTKTGSAIPVESVLTKIYVIRGQKVILDRDIALLYEVETNYLKRQVRRNADRFPEDFMFELTKDEYNSLRSQFGTLKRGEHSKYLPMAFTEQGVGMLSGVINSGKAVQMHIAIVRAFVALRQVALQNKQVAEKLRALEERIGEHDTQLHLIYETIENLLDKKAEEMSETENWKNRPRIGFK